MGAKAGHGFDFPQAVKPSTEVTEGQNACALRAQRLCGRGLEGGAERRSENEIMLNLFIEYLCAERQISPKRVAEYGSVQPDSREPFGAIAVRYELLRPEDIESVLENKNRLERFGETAFRLGYLRERDIEHILMLQSMLDISDFVGWAMFQGLIDKSDLIQTMHSFWAWLETNKPNPWERELGTYRGSQAAAPAGSAVGANG